MCCASVPDCVNFCVRSTTKFDEVKDDDPETVLRFFDECQRQCRIYSRSINHNRYFNHAKNKYCFGEGPNEKIVKTVIAKPGQSCTQACHALSATDYLIGN